MITRSLFRARKRNGRVGERTQAHDGTLAQSPADKKSDSTGHAYTATAALGHPGLTAPRTSPTRCTPRQCCVDRRSGPGADERMVEEERGLRGWGREHMSIAAGG